MKKKKLQNSNGITICDSIVMSVRHKRPNVRSFEAVCIAVIGYVSVIMAFLKMFSFKYDASRLFFAAVIFAAVYIYASLCGKKGSYFVAASSAAALVIAYRNIEKLSLGVKFMYNTIYHAAFRTEIEYYKFLKPAQERGAVTAFFIFCAWLIAVTVFYFTINRPNPIPPLLVTFPVIEVGLYNGIEISVFWGVMVIAYWLALFAMSTIDIGEYSGGNGGFVRKENIFFPKRQMRLKVTEKCGVLVILAVVCTGALASGFITVSRYKRSDEINRKRVEIRDAVNSFSIDNLAESLSDISNAFGMDFKYENHRLGNIDRLRYRDSVDLKVFFDKAVNGAVYLKDYTGSVYSGNEWKSLPEETYAAPIFTEFEKYKTYPQVFPSLFSTIIDPENAVDYRVKVTSELKGDRSFVPYGISGIGITDSYEKDLTCNVKKTADKTAEYVFTGIDRDVIAAAYGSQQRNALCTDYIDDSEYVKLIGTYCIERDMLNFGNYFTIDSALPAKAEELYSSPQTILAQLVEQDYREFVYDNYLEVSDNADMKEVREAYRDILEMPDDSIAQRLDKLIAIRDKMTSEVSYSLNPGRTPSNRDFVNYFLLENKKGYCTHYATSGVILARMAGIPARYATGYVIVGDDFNADNKKDTGGYSINVMDNRSHAWAEVYLDGYGWIPFEFTAGYSSQTIDPTSTTTEPTTEEETIAETTKASEPPETTAPHSEITASSGSKTTMTTATNAEETATTTADGKFGAGGNGADDNTPHKELPTAVKNVIRTVLLLAAFIGFVLFRRWMRLRVRLMHFTTGTNSQKIAYIYDYAESLLKTKGREKGDMPYSDFAKETETMLGGRYFEFGQFEKFVETALRAGFDEAEPDGDELTVCRNFADALAEKLYEEKNWFWRIVMKYFTVLI